MREIHELLDTLENAEIPLPHKRGILGVLWERSWRMDQAQLQRYHAIAESLRVRYASVTHEVPNTLRNGSQTSTYPEGVDH
jgi:hypothetical protein